MVTLFLKLKLYFLAFRHGCSDLLGSSVSEIPEKAKIDFKF
jgi:hypothetical protein